MPTDLRVPDGVAVGRTVAAQCCAARLTGPQVHPSCAYLDALLALMAFRVFDGGDSAKMRSG